MNSRQRLQATLNHQQPDRVCVDFGSTFITGMHVSIVDKLRKAVLGDMEYKVKINEPYQMLGEIDDELREAIGIDVVGRLPRKSIFGTDETDFKPFTMFDGTEVLVPHNFNFTVEESTGDILIYAEGDASCPPSGRMPKGGYFFDSIIRQEPIIENQLDPQDNLEEFDYFNDKDIAYYKEVRKWFDDHNECGSIVIIPGSAFGDIALVPAPFLKNPKGIRDIEEWYMSIAMRPDYIKAVFDKQCEIALHNIEIMIDILGDSVQAAVITGTDFGMQTGPFLSNATYRDLFKPYHQKVNDLIHSRSHWKTFIHSCGGVWPLIPEFIEAGFDILNPVQCSAANMDGCELKKTFGKDVVFWGGGVDTQKTMMFGTPNEVYNEVRERIDIFNDGGGFVFNAIHNIQGNVPLANVQSMFKAINDSR